MEPTSRFQLGYVLPALVLLFLCADALSRLVPLDRLSFRAWEGMLTRPAPDGPFAPSKRYDNPRAYGDLASFANRPDLRDYRRETFTTDEHGFRSARHLLPPGPVEAVLTGDSFGVGSGVSDEQILSVQLAALAGRPVYNAAGREAARLEDLRAIARRVGMSRGVVIYEYFEHVVLPPVPRGPLYAGRRGHRLQALQPLKDRWDDLRVSRLSILVSRLQRALGLGPRDDRALVLPLQGGEPFLFLGADIECFYDPPAARAGYLAGLAAELAKDHLRLLVVLVPSKYTVYEPLLLRRDPRSPGPRQYLDRMEEVLSTAGVPVVNLIAPLRQGAAAALARGERVYFRDDTHWNERGIALAAARIRSAWAALAR